MICPKCGSEHIQAVDQQIVKGHVHDTRRTKGFGWCKGCLGGYLFGCYGWLCGLCGMGKTKGKFKDKRKYSNEITFICLDCGHKFK